MTTLAIVCARSGSKRLSEKHSHFVGKRPVGEYAIQAAKDSMAKEVVVSSDDPFMLELARGCGVTGLRRNPQDATDQASIHRAMQHVLRLWPHPARAFKHVVCIPANIPTVTGKTINRAIRALQADEDATASMTVKKVCCPPEWMWYEDCNRLHRFKKNKLYRLQDLDERLIATGTCAVVRTAVLMTCDRDDAFAWLGSKVVPVMDTGAIEIHDKDDLALARKVMA